MPRVNSLDPTRRRLDRISDYIRREMHKRRIRQREIAEIFGVSQQAFSMKLSRGTFTAAELIRIFDFFETDNKQTGDLIRNE